MAKKISKKVIIEKLHLKEYTKSEIVPNEEYMEKIADNTKNIYYKNGSIHFFYGEWNTNTFEIERNGFVKTSEVKFIDSKGRDTAYGCIGAKTRDYVFLYNKEEDKVAVVERYFHQYTDGITGATRSKVAWIYDAEQFRG